MSDDLDIDIEATLDNYAFSAPYGAVKLGEYWVSRGKTADEAGEIAANYAVSEIEASGANKKRLVDRLFQSNQMIETMLDGLTNAYDIEDPRDA